MKTQIININGEKIKIPDYYRKAQKMPDDPVNSEPYLIMTEHSHCFMMIEPVDFSRSMPRNQKEFIKGIRRFLGDNQGLIQVETKESHMYSIIKTLRQEGGVQYALTYQKFCSNFIIEIHAFFDEESPTGYRDSIVYEWCKRNGNISCSNGKIRGWNQDPYDKSIQSGALMNLSEQEKFDEKFPDFPLSMCRSLVKVLEAEE